MPTKSESTDRRAFLRSAAAGAALSLSARSYAATTGANERIRVGFLGCGARAQAHVHLITSRAAELGTSAVAVCDVWDGLEEHYEQKTSAQVVRRKYSQGLFPTAQKCGLDSNDRCHVTKDYRRVLDRKDVDVVCIATPDHWHARMVLDAVAAGKDLMVEPPLARTAAGAIAVLDAAKRCNRIVALGEKTLASPQWSAVGELIRQKEIGPVVHTSAAVFRTDPRGYWRFYRVVPEMNPATIDWDLFLGHHFQVAGEPLGPTPDECPFDRATFAQWRCRNEFSSGPFSELMVSSLARLSVATGLGFPSRVTGVGGLYQEQDGRSIPDLGTMIAEYDAGCQFVVTAGTGAGLSDDETIRGRNGSIRFGAGGYELLREKSRQWVAVETPANETESLWVNFLDAVRRRDSSKLMGSAELGASTSTAIALAVESARVGRSIVWDSSRRVGDSSLIWSPPPMDWTGPSPPIACPSGKN